MTASPVRLVACPAAASSTLASVPAVQAPARAGWLPPGVAIFLQVSILVFLLAGSSAPTPLYAVYQAAWGFSPITMTVVFGVYALAVLASLLTVGSLSDYIGRRPVLIVAMLAQAVTMLVFASADAVSDLLVARVIQGLATGAAVGALGAGLLDLHKARGTVANSVAPMVGTAAGAIGASLMVQYLPEPTHLVYHVLFTIFVMQAVGVVLMPESATRKPGALASLRPQFGIPPLARRPLLVATPALVAIWALVGFYASLGPSLVRLMLGSSSILLGGLSLFVLAGSGALTVLLLGSAAPRRQLLFGAATLLVGVALTLVAIVQASAFLFFIGTAAAGAGFGGAFQGALRTVVPLAASHERAGVLSTIFALCYLAMGVPAVVAGVLAVYGGGVVVAGQEYSAAILLLSALALLGVLWTGERQTAGRPSLRSRLAVE
jgi:MFS family permease